MPLTVTITLDDADPRMRKVLDAIGLPMATAAKSVNERVIAALAAIGPAKSRQIRTAVAADGLPPATAQSIANSLVALKAQGLAALDANREWRYVPEGSKR